MVAIQAEGFADDRRVGEDVELAKGIPPAPWVPKAGAKKREALFQLMGFEK